MTQTIVYASCAESREIHVFSLDTLSGEVQLRLLICYHLDALQMWPPNSQKYRLALWLPVFDFPFNTPP